MKLKAAFAFILAAVIATATVSAQTAYSDPAVPRPRLDMKLAFNPTDTSVVISEQPALPQVATAPLRARKLRGNLFGRRWPAR